MKKKVSWHIELEQERDGRWISEIQTLPGVMVYAATKGEAICRFKVLALCILADRLEHGKELREVGSVFAIAS